ncbi:LLM class F420-dependent oxidoreductase [Nocardioides marmoribigeumensis]|uniref:F420-dependent oxidoreductase-like protein n=1 Tax=Nocardioides marmoribigeumensis TaxID=433649 RepID=A0ABU2BZG3_9ACTN|nr:LLM class F420-dependent oxidoreductase [Nocardioides marmoribigeumensis]MDR7363793.1 F420-dependent oxidoreductase-like protein [Nocardioides marmoribigeumensis]
MQLGVHYANFTHPDWQSRLADRLDETARVADQGGVSLLSVMDHFFQMEMLGGPPEPMLEGYTTLGHLSGLTERVRLTLLVTGVTYRHPGLLAKQVATLDVLSRGRAVLGLGAAWYEREHLGLGVPFPPLAERFERLEETLRVVHQMWGDDDGAFEGTHYRLAETVCVPPPVQRPHPRILLGGSGEQKTLRLVARYAGACNLFGAETDVIGHKLDVLRRHCEVEGTDYDAIEKTVLVSPDAEGWQGLVRRAEALAPLGVDTVVTMPGSDDPVAEVTTLVEEVVPRLADLG